MSRINLKIFKCSWWQWLLILVFLWLAVVLWPMKSFLLPSNWWGDSLIVVMNDNEARPCGGFATAYGELRLPIFKLKVNNSYALDADLGEALPPLDQVANRLKFWDLGTATDLNQCAQDFKAGYRANTDKSVDRVILVQMSFLENWAKLLGQDDFFAVISRSVADVDHHDEGALAQRKSPAGNMIKSLVKKTVLNPLKWSKFTQLVHHSQYKKSLFWSHKNKSQNKSRSNTISLVEWNLGGGKSSRYLRKNWNIDLQQITPDSWMAELAVQISHLGQYDEPLSQTWQGQFEFTLFSETYFIPATIKPGENWSFRASYEIQRPAKSLNIYTPPTQDWDTNFSISILAGQTLLSKKLDTQESVGTWPKRHHKCKNQTINWEILPDKLSPFITLHEYISWEEDDLLTEIHFNEPIKITDNSSAELTDRNFEVSSITEHPEFKSWELLEDQVTLLIHWSQTQFQKDERFYVRLSGIEDIWGNKLSDDERTIITR